MKKTLTFVLSAAVLCPMAASAAERSFVGVAPQTEVVVGDSQDAYGTTTLTAYVLPAQAFVTRASTTTFNTGGGVDRFQTNAGFLDASPMIPAGAQIERVELRACDSDAAASVGLNMGPCPTGGAGCTLAGSVATGAAPGCNNFSTTLAAPIIVDNVNTPILVQITTGFTPATTFSSVKLYYRLRVSAAPAVASFNDVPTGHFAFRFVEALAASGITGGCGAGTYCPDSPVTRAQMAIFLATALGLHFPN